MLIRAKTPADTTACAALIRVTHETDGYPRYLPADPERFVSSAHELMAWVAVLQGAVVGHVALHDASVDPTLPAAQRATGLPADGLAVLARLLVSPDVRHVGLGRRLVDIACRYARQQRRRVVLDVVRDSPAVAMYEALGWQRLEELELRLDGSRSLDLWVYLEPDVDAPPNG